MEVLAPPEQTFIDLEFAAMIEVDLLDLDVFNVELQDIPDMVLDVAPEAEIYGRSLGTIRKLGTLMLFRPLVETVASPEAAQAKVEFFTSVEEGFGTDMELGGGLEVRDYDNREIIDGRVMAKDLKTPISEMTESGLICAEATLAIDERFRPQYVRSEWDHHNALIVDKMARGETGYNTRIIVSPFPDEAATDSGDEYWRNIGYVPHLKRGFVQLYHVNENGKLLSGSLSFDGSKKEKIKEVLGTYGVDIPEDETTDNFLKYAYIGTISEENAKYIATDIADKSKAERSEPVTNTVDVTLKYRPLLERVFNESYVHLCESLVRGYQTEGVQNLVLQLYSYASSFRNRYSQSLNGMLRNMNSFTSDDSIVLHELLVYSTIEMMRSLHLGTTSNVYNTFSESYTADEISELDEGAFQNILGGFGADGANSNRTYSACGLSISAGGEGNPQGAFGDIDGGEDMFGSLDFQCNNGHWNRRQRNTLMANCLICGDSVKC